MANFSFKNFFLKPDKEDNMFKTQEINTFEREQNTEQAKTDNFEEGSVEIIKKQKRNSIVKGSKLIGDINISYDLELDGDVEGNITSEQKSNIIIKGNCKGNIKTREGNVEIEGRMTNGDIIAGGDIKITGKFNGGKAEAKGKIYVNGEFNGKLESNEIEIGPRAQGKGELLYKETISIAKGAKIEVQINKFQGEQKETKKTNCTEVVNIKQPLQEVKLKAAR